MTRYASALAIPVIVGLPLWINASWDAVALAAASGLFCAGGLVWLSVTCVALGEASALLAFALAVWRTSSTLNLFAAIAFGLALLLLFDAVNLTSRFKRAEIDRSVWRSHAAWWIGRAAISSAAAALLVAAASVLSLALPIFGRPLLAAAGAIAAFAAAVSLASPSKHRASWRDH
jgi:hypothetical protein